jgi:hypothetical protein
VVLGYRSDQHVRVLHHVSLVPYFFCPWLSGSSLIYTRCRLYHCNPWADTLKGGCYSFDQYLSNPTGFFMRQFTGMTLPVANFLIENVFCILDDPTDDSQRIGAREFGLWIRDLPTLMRASQLTTHTHSRAPSSASVATGHPIASAPASSRPSSRQASFAGGSPRRPSVALRSLSRHTPVDPILDRDGPENGLPHTLSSVLSEEDEEEEEHERDHQQAEDGRSPSLRSVSTTKRRKRGRKGKGMTPSTDHIQTSDLLASASQTLARELSRQTRSASAAVQSFLDIPPPPPVPVPASIPTVTKKPSRWKLSFGRSAGETVVNARSESRSAHSSANSGSTRATNVTSIIMGLNPSSVSSTPHLPSSSPPPPPPPVPQSLLESPVRGRGEPQVQAQSRRAGSPASTRSGRPLASSSSSAMSSNNWRNSTSSTNTSSSAFTRYSNQSMRSVSTFATTISTSSASSSTNWRKHPDPTFPSGSSVASSVHSNSGTQNGHINGLPRRPPSNIKCTYFSTPATLVSRMHLLTGRSSVMNGVPWELSGAPRQLHQKEMDIFGAPPQPRERKRAARGGGKGKQPATGTGGKSALEPITERPQHHTQYRQDAATSTTDLATQSQGQHGTGHVQGSHGQGLGGQDSGGGEAPKIGKAHANALAKILSFVR